MKLCVGIPSNCGLPLWPPIVGGHSGNTVELWPPGNTVQLWPPTVASHCGLPLWPPTVASHCGRPWEYRSKLLLSICLCFLKGGHGRPQLEAMGIPLTIAFDQFPYVFLWEATGGHGRPREATGGHGNTARARYLDLKSLFL